MPSSSPLVRPRSVDGTSSARERQMPHNDFTSFASICDNALGGNVHASEFAEAVVASVGQRLAFCSRTVTPASDAAPSEASAGLSCRLVQVCFNADPGVAHLVGVRQQLSHREMLLLRDGVTHTEPVPRYVTVCGSAYEARDEAILLALTLQYLSVVRPDLPERLPSIFTNTNFLTTCHFLLDGT